MNDELQMELHLNVTHANFCYDIFENRVGRTEERRSEIRRLDVVPRTVHDNCGWINRTMVVMRTSSGPHARSHGNQHALRLKRGDQSLSHHEHHVMRVKQSLVIQQEDGGKSDITRCKPHISSINMFKVLHHAKGPQNWLHQQKTQTVC